MPLDSLLLTCWVRAFSAARVYLPLGIWSPRTLNWGGHEIRQQERSPMAGSPPTNTSDGAYGRGNPGWDKRAMGVSLVPRRLRPAAKHKYLGVESGCEERQKLSLTKDTSQYKNYTNYEGGRSLLQTPWKCAGLPPHKVWTEHHGYFSGS